MQRRRYPGQVRLQAVLGVGGLRDAVCERYVDVVELVPHLVGRGVEQDLDLVAQLVRGSAFALGVQDVVVRELGPRVRQRASDGGPRKQHKSSASLNTGDIWSSLVVITAGGSFHRCGPKQPVSAAVG